ncbi:hypothetical protein GIB67_035870 [Kingdonia uniflora]|uniref:Cytochrome P450 n=1 Tax=Kingdonia uniflora TaxID=39325 RepID=A0A7J7NVU1_9MAGN|nr:hypothetical protein GIB67_035870 [Kingdonia uniflora]
MGRSRDPAVWKEPLQFRPERFLEEDVDMKGHDFRLLPFGAGRRICPGAQLAINLVTSMLGHLLHHFSWAPPEGVKPEDIDLPRTLGCYLYEDPGKGRSYAEVGSAFVQAYCCLMREFVVLISTLVSCRLIMEENVYESTINPQPPEQLVDINREQSMSKTQSGTTPLQITEEEQLCSHMESSCEVPADEDRIDLNDHFLSRNKRNGTVISLLNCYQLTELIQEPFLWPYNNLGFELRSPIEMLERGLLKVSVQTAEDAKTYF